MLRKAVILWALVAACGEAEDKEVSDAASLVGGDAAVPAGDATAPSSSDGSTAVQTDAAAGGTTGGNSLDSGSVGGGAEAGSGGKDAGSNTVGDSGSTPVADATVDSGAPQNLEKFSFFVTSLAALRKLSGSQSGFGGDLRFGETGDGAGLKGADKICTTIAETSMPGSGAKQWRAFLSTSKVHAKDRIGQGPWYDRKGRVLAMNLAALLKERPEGANAQIINDFPNELGVPNHDPDGTGKVDNHDMLTGSNAMGMLYTGRDAPAATCNDWTSAERSGKPRVGHSWPRTTGGSLGGSFGGGGAPGGIGGGDGSMNNWMSALDEAGCAPGVSLIEMGPPQASNPTVGSGGGYGGFYCFALTP
jgi:hypothetical protein